MSDFSSEQKHYLEGFVRGNNLAREALGTPVLHKILGGNPAAAVSTDPHDQARSRFVAEGKKLVPEEEAKAAKDPFALWDLMAEWAESKTFPKGTDIFLMKYHGLFYVAPAQNAFMARLRIPGGQLTSHQLRGLAAMADRWADGSSHVTTRANFQLRNIQPENTLQFLMDLSELGLTSRGSGADNVRNVTGSPTSGVDPQELIDTQPYCRDLHHFILNHTELYGLPRKFNIAFDGGGKVASVDDTNDIGYYAVRVSEGKTVPAGVYFRLRLGGITGHQDFAKDEGVILEPSQHLKVSEAILRVFLERGDRTDRKRARMKYVLDAMGHEAFLTEVETKLGAPLLRFPLSECEPRPEPDKWGHIGFHRQKNEGKVWAGVLTPVGKLTSDQMRGLAKLADEWGSGQIRLTVWQNLLIPDVDEAKITAFEAALAAYGLTARTASLKKNLIACTGNTGCKYANSDTKRHALAIADHVDARLAVDAPVNIHLTGCPHSCAQHYIGDIGLLGTKVSVSEDDEVEGYHVFLGGGYGSEQCIARPFRQGVKAGDCPDLVEGLLKVYLQGRQSPEESFHHFTGRVSNEEIESALAGSSEAAS